MGERKRVLVVGDVMLDRYFYVNTSREAQEAPIPVWDCDRREYRLGGAANLANNLKSIGGDEVDVHLAGLYGGPESDTVRRLLSRAGIESVLSVWLGSDTMTKDRYVDKHMRLLFRADNIKRFNDEDTDVFSVMMEQLVESHDYDAIVVSDYDKGTVDERVTSLLSRYPISFVDSKRADLRVFRDFTVLKLNEPEYNVQASSGLYGTSFESLFKYCVVTRGPKGAELREYDHGRSSGRSYVVHSEQFPLQAHVQPVDVTGCGDTHTAASLFTFLKTGDIRRAVNFANRCASAKVQMFGTDVPRGVPVE